MSHVIRKSEKGNGPIVGASTELMHDVYFDLLTFKKGESVRVSVPGFEIIAVVQSGRCTITAGDTEFPDVGGRADIWSGKADSVYAGSGGTLTISGLSDTCEVAVAGGRSDEDFAPFRVTPDDVESVVVGSSETKSRREIFHILGQNANGRAGRLLVSELYCEEGCWSGYPPHKHDQARDGETDHAEVYHYRFNPPTGFGAQFLYDGDNARAVMTHDGDTFLVPSGYHPTVASPGHSAYVFTILVGRDQRGLVQYFDPQHAHLLDHIPGLADMREKFK